MGEVSFFLVEYGWFADDPAGRKARVYFAPGGSGQMITKRRVSSSGLQLLCIDEDAPRTRRIEVREQFLFIPG